MSLEADQLPDLREPKLIFAPLQILLGLCVGVYITFPLLGPWRLLMYVLEHHGLVPALVVAAPCYLFYGVQVFYFIFYFLFFIFFFLFFFIFFYFFFIFFLERGVF